MTRKHGLVFLNLRKTAAMIVAVLSVTFVLMRTAHAAGGLDLSFGYAGKVVTDFYNKYDAAYDMAIQPDGKIVVIGVSHFDYTAWDDFAIARYNSDGTLDASFGSGGKAHVDFFNSYDTAYSLAFQSDGKIVVAGSAWTGNYYGFSNFGVARFNTDGSIDSTFGNGGKVAVDFQTMEDEAKAVVIQPDGKIVLAGTARVDRGGVHDTDIAVVRLNNNGTLDTDFGDAGKLHTHLPSNLGWTNDFGAAVALSPDRKIVVGGSCACGNYKAGLARYNPDGSLDSTFDSDGMVITDFFGTDSGSEVRSMVILPDGKIFTVGYAGHGSGLVFALTRYNSDGSLDSTFDGDGKAWTPAPTGADNATDFAITSSGKIVVVGYTSAGTYTLARFWPDGSLDTVFGSRGRIFTIMTTASAAAHAVAIQADGKILAAGQTSDYYLSVSDFGIMRYKANPISTATRSDFDGDGKTDQAVFRPSDGVWYVLNSSTGMMSAQPFGMTGDIAAPGDYDGDGGRTDYAVFRPSAGTWFILNSSNNTFRAEWFGLDGDVPVPADYDGDGRSDVAVFRPSNGVWYILRSSDNGFQAQAFGVSTDRPIPGYYDNDEKADIAVFRASEGRWYLLQSSNNALVIHYWGTVGDYPVGGDYDGDGRYDIAVYRPSTEFWYILKTMTNYADYIKWGAPGYRPVPGDYDGDGKMDIAVWRPETGSWNIQIHSSTVFGTTGDVAVPEAYLH